MGDLRPVEAERADAQSHEGQDDEPHFIPAPAGAPVSAVFLLLFVHADAVNVIFSDYCFTDTYLMERRRFDYCFAKAIRALAPIRSAPASIRA